MPTYNSNELDGKGILIPGFSTGQDFIIHNSGLNSYFTLETIRNGEGFYDTLSPTNTLGVFANLVNVHDLIGSPYIASFIVNQGTGSFTFYPDEAVPDNSLYLRAAGKMEVTTTPI
jgi:hypothetical protein